MVEMPHNIASHSIGTIVMNFGYLPLIAMCTYLGISFESFGLLAILLMIDYATGTAKVYVINKSNLKSYKAIAGIIAKMSLLLIPIVIALAAKQIGYDLKSFTDTLISMLVLAESYSIIGNIRSIQAKEEVPEVDFISVILRKVSKVVEVMLKKY